jgi:hypothetical protein
VRSRSSAGDDAGLYGLMMCGMPAAGAVSTRTRATPRAMPAAELTDEMIAAAVAKADTRVCVGNPRCYPFLDRLEDARQSCTPKGRCKDGWMVRAGGREAWDVWLEVSTALGKLIRRADA